MERSIIGSVTTDSPLLDIDAVTVPVDDLDSGLRFYRDALGHTVLWRNDVLGQAGLRVGSGNAEIVLTTRQRYEPNWLVSSIDTCIARFVAHGGRVVEEAAKIPVGRVAVVEDPFGNPLVIVELSKGSNQPDGAVVPTA